MLELLGLSFAFWVDYSILPEHQIAMELSPTYRQVMAGDEIMGPIAECRENAAADCEDEGGTCWVCVVGGQNPVCSWGCRDANGECPDNPPPCGPQSWVTDAPPHVVE